MGKPRTPKTDPQSIIRCGNPDDAKLAYMAMFRKPRPCSACPRALPTEPKGIAV